MKTNDEVHESICTNEFISFYPKMKCIQIVTSGVLKRKHSGCGRPQNSTLYVGLYMSLV